MEGSIAEAKQVAGGGNGEYAHLLPEKRDGNAGKRGERTRKFLRVLPVAIFVALLCGRAACWQPAYQPAHNKPANAAHTNTGKQHAAETTKRSLSKERF